MSAPSKESLLESFVPGAAIPIRETMLKIYGYGVTDPKFVETALERLEGLGCSSIRETYQSAVKEWKAEHEDMLKRVSSWYVGWCKRNEENEKRRESELSRKLKTMSRKDFSKLYQKLKEKKIVEDPDQFAEMVTQYL